jgi:VWFA-related protein
MTERGGSTRDANCGRRALLLACAVALTLALTAQAALAQTRGLSVALAGFAAEDWARAQAVVTVTDGDGATIPSLTAQAVSAEIEGEDVVVTDVTRGVDSSLPIAVVLALDVSGSMEGGPLDQAKLAAHAFLDGLGEQDSVAVVAFGDGVTAVQDFTTDKAAAGAAIDGLVAAGATALYQATEESLRLAAAAESSRRVVVLLSDGVDNGSAVTREAAIAAATSLSIPVYAIGLGADIDRAYLQELAEVGGGRFAETPSGEGLAALYREVSEQLRGQYVLTLDASGLDLSDTDAVALAVRVTLGDEFGADERLVCPVRLCAGFAGLEPDARISEATTLVAEIVSADAIESVTLIVDGSAVATISEPPYEFPFDPAGYTSGSHTLTLEVTTTAGAVAGREVSVRTGGGAGGMSKMLLAAAALLLVVVAGAGFVFFVRRRRGKGLRPQPLHPLGGPGPIPLRERRRPILLDEPAPVTATHQPGAVLGHLHAMHGPLAGQVFPVGAAPLSVGSGHRCAVRLPNELPGGFTVATEHVRAWVRDGHLMVHEMRRLTEMGAEGGGWEILSDGDTFSIGSCTFRFALAAEAAAPVEPSREPASQEALAGRPPVSPEASTGLAGAMPQGVPNILKERSSTAERGGDAALEGGPSPRADGTFEGLAGPRARDSSASAEG